MSRFQTTSHLHHFHSSIKSSLHNLSRPLHDINLVFLRRSLLLLYSPQGILMNVHFHEFDSCHQGLTPTNCLLSPLFSWAADVFLRLSFSVMIYRLFIGIFFLLPHVIGSSFPLFLIECIASKDGHLFFFFPLILFFFLLSHLNLITVTTRYALCFSYYVARLLSVYHLLSMFTTCYDFLVSRWQTSLHFGALVTVPLVLLKY